MKANDKDVPADEILLAEAIAAARARGMKWCRGHPFRAADGWRTIPSRAVACCALGALHLAGEITEADIVNLSNQLREAPRHLLNVYRGNDYNALWDLSRGDRGESLGWAFRCAMEDV